MNSISDLNFDLKKQKILRIRAQNETREEKRRLNDIDVLCRLLSSSSDDNNNATTDELSDLSTIESSVESSDCRQSGSSESLHALSLEESLLLAEIQELTQKRPEVEVDDNDDEDLKEFTRIEKELRIAEINKLLESVRQQMKARETQVTDLRQAFSQRSAPLAESESLCSREESPLRQLRPLTLYMPIVEEELDLQHHIHTLGHETDCLAPQVIVTRFTCFGYLSKLCQNSDKNWRKRSVT